MPWKTFNSDPESHPGIGSVMHSSRLYADLFQDSLKLDQGTDSQENMDLRIVMCRSCCAYSDSQSTRQIFLFVENRDFLIHVCEHGSYSFYNFFPNRVNRGWGGRAFGVWGRNSETATVLRHVGLEKTCCADENSWSEDNCQVGTSGEANMKSELIGGFQNANKYGVTTVVL